MSAKKPAANAPKTVVADVPDDRKSWLRNIGGSQSDHWNNILANQAMQSLWMKNSSAEDREVAGDGRVARGPLLIVAVSPSSQRVRSLPEFKLCTRSATTCPQRREPEAKLRVWGACFECTLQVRPECAMLLPR
jgi:hypothetical protein